MLRAKMFAVEFVAVSPAGLFVLFSIILWCSWSRKRKENNLMRTNMKLKIPDWL